MKQKVKAHSSAMLLELIIVIGFFAVISVFLLKMFVSADSTRKEALRLSKATVLVESAFEVVSRYDNVEEAFNVLGYSTVDEDGAKVRVAYYDESWKQTNIVSRYTIKIYETKETHASGVLSTFDAVVREEPKEGKEAEDVLKMSTKEYKRGVD